MEQTLNNTMHEKIINAYIKYLLHLNSVQKYHLFNNHFRDQIIF